jgi:hypothetical protein
VIWSATDGQIRRLCQRVLWLDRGRVKFLGDAGSAIGEYESALLRGDGEVAAGQCFSRWEIPGVGHTLRQTEKPFVIRVHARLDEPLVGGHYGLGVYDDQDA